MLYIASKYEYDSFSIHCSCSRCVYSQLHVTVVAKDQWVILKSDN